jgi:hypothetical protein
MEGSTMFILPRNTALAEQPYWVVKWLRYIGFIICAGCLIAGFAYGAFMLAPTAQLSLGFPKGVAVPLATLLAGLLGYMIGLGISLPFWAMSAIMDDLHALRVYASGYVTIDDTNG